MDSPARVFVSSVMREFAEPRSVVRSAIEAAGCEPVMAELFEPTGESPRSACLEGVRSSDALILIVGARGGFETPAGVLAVREEFDEARRRGHTCFLLIMSGVERDASAAALVNELSSYVDGAFRHEFAELDELASLVRRACKQIPPSGASDSIDDATWFERKLSEPLDVAHHPVVRVAVHSERLARDLFSAHELSSPGTQKRLVLVGLDEPASLFDLNAAREVRRTGDTVVIHQSSRATSRAGARVRGVRLEVSESARVVLDLEVIESSSDAISSLLGPLSADAVEEALVVGLTYVDRFLATFDEWREHSTLRCNASVGGLQYRTLVRSVGAGDEHHRGWMPGRGSVVVARDISLRVSRSDSGWVMTVARELTERLVLSHSPGRL